MAKKLILTLMQLIHTTQFELLGLCQCGGFSAASGGEAVSGRGLEGRSDFRRTFSRQAKPNDGGLEVAEAGELVLLVV